MMLKILYGAVAVLVLVMGWQILSHYQTSRFLEGQAAQSYGAAPDNAKVTIIAFMDYTCRSCKESNAGILQAVAENPDARIIFHPLPQASSALSVKAARAALAAAKQGQFMAMHEELMRNERPLTDDLIRGIAEKFNMDAAQLEADALSEDITAQLLEAARSAIRLKIEVTPSFVFNRRALYVPAPGDVPYRSVSQLIQQTRS